MKYLSLEKPSPAFLWTVIIILAGASVILAIQTRIEVLSGHMAYTMMEAAIRREVTSRKNIELLSARCITLKKQCTEITKLRELQEEALFTYIRKNYRKISILVAREIAKQTVLICAERDAPFRVIVGIMEVESSFSPTAVSEAGARGLMQVMPKIWVKEFKYLGNVYNLHEINLGIKAGVDVYLGYFKSRKTISGALARYFGADDPDYKAKVFKAISQFTFHVAERR